MKQSPTGEMVATPGSLLSQYKLLRAVIDAPWATRLDIKITSHVIDRYYSKFEVARASLRYLELATGATRPNVIESLRRLAGQGVISVVRQGIGTRPTEYGLVFDFVKNKNPFAKNKNLIRTSASGSVDDTSTDGRGIVDDTSNKDSSGTVGNTSTSGIVDDTSCGIADDTSRASSGIVHDTESYLRNVLTSTLTVSRNEDAPAGPTAPPVLSLEAHTAETAVDPEKAALPNGFQELWNVWPRKHDISKARAAYKALAPNSTLHATLVAKANQWAAHYQQTATEKKWWKHLHNWLGEDRYLEDPPEPYENPKEAAIARKRQNGPRKAKKQETGKSGLSSGTPIGRHKASIVKFDMTGVSFDQEREFVVSFKIEDGDYCGKEFSHTFSFASDDEATLTAGQAHFTNIRQATGILEPVDTSDFHGKMVQANVKAMGRIEYSAS